MCNCATDMDVSVRKFYKIDSNTNKLWCEAQQTPPPAAASESY